MAKTRESVTRAEMLKVIGLLVTVSVFFVVLYLPDEVLQAFGAKMELVGKILTKLGVTFTVSSVGFWFLFSVDHLATGKGLKSRFFRHYYPSTYAVEHCGMSQVDANEAWFTYFNKWVDETHPHHTYYLFSFKRSYACRGIYYLLPLLVVCLAGATASVVDSLMTPGIDMHAPLLLSQELVWFVAAGVTIWVYLSNRVREKNTTSYEDKYDATGAFKQYKEIEGILRTLFYKEVLQPLGCKPA